MRTQRSLKMPYKYQDLEFARDLGEKSRKMVNFSGKELLLKIIGKNDLVETDPLVHFKFNLVLIFLYFHPPKNKEKSNKFPFV